MKTKQQLTLAYAAGRSNLLIMTVLTAVNAALALFGTTWSFLFTAFFPYVCANWAQYGYLGMSAEAGVLLGCLLPIAAWAACWALSGKQRYGWLKIAAALFALDTLYMAYFFIAYGFDRTFILTVLFHALVLWQLIRASAAARRLAEGDFEEEPVSAGAPAPADAGQAAEETGQAAEEAPAPADFRYDLAYARSTGANKAGRIVLSILIFLIWMCGGAFLCLWLLEMKLELGFGVAIPVIVVVCLAAVAWFIVAMVRLSAFLEASAAVYRVLEDGTLTRDKMDLPPFNHTVFYRPEIIGERDDRWVLRYENPAGRQRKAVIPKAYPGLERYMAAVGRAEETPYG